jgi:hypothetical protein
MIETLDFTAVGFAVLASSIFSYEIFFQKKENSFMTFAMLTVLYGVTSLDFIKHQQNPVLLWILSAGSLLVSLLSIRKPIVLDIVDKLSLGVVVACVGMGMVFSGVMMGWISFATLIAGIPYFFHVHFAIRVDKSSKIAHILLVLAFLGLLISSYELGEDTTFAWVSFIYWLAIVIRTALKKEYEFFD